MLELTTNHLRETCAQEQVIHDSRQVTSLEDLIPGKKYQLMRKDQGRVIAGEEVIVFQKPNKDGLFEVQIPSKFQFEWLLAADHGIIPYNNPQIPTVIGLWNKVNYMIPV